MTRRLRLISVAWALALMLFAMAMAANPSHVIKCSVKKYKHCYNSEHVCPELCPDSCTVECVSCKPLCGVGPTIPSIGFESPSPLEDKGYQPIITSPPELPQTPPQSIPSPLGNISRPLADDSSEAARGRKGRRRRIRRCRKRNYPQCYGIQHVCPRSCPNTCEIDCTTCKPVCKCDMPGGVCQDPRFIGGDGITFYFHGSKDRDFCLVTDSDLHINAHFIGKRNMNMKRDFTWVQSVGVLFGSHRLYIGAQRTAKWSDAVDRLSLAFNGQRVTLPTTEGATWHPDSGLPSISIKRDGTANGANIRVEGLFEISAKVVPITLQESRNHNYGITEDNCFAHLELGFKFFSLGEGVSGVLGRTYARGYVSRAKMGVSMPVLGGEKEFAVSGLFAADCAASKFRGGDQIVIPESS
ncbi:late embryogenesis abundant protein-related / LEA protein-related [Striga hermonthica]|uniref:Late embryogenesis abundant protein-related / LEA protein-related n=1 Tax=Striga hermonthica TaxID=68872 RepID=A0A9N7R101_STRHE|nr:late embryogenesis abundant protein-related / LEA protein-related [Striga hermonthica]